MISIAWYARPLAVAGLLGLFVGLRDAAALERQFPLDVDLADRVDPVPPGGDIVYEIELENFTDQAAPDVVVTDFLPPGTTFVSAYRQPAWNEVAAEVEPGLVRLLVGSVEPCDMGDTTRCRDIWLALRVDESVSAGAVVENRVRIESSDPLDYPTNEASRRTTVGTAKIDTARLLVGEPGRDGFTLRVDIGRSGLRRAIDPPTPTIDPSGGLLLRVGAPGTPLLELDIPPSALACTDPHGNPARPIQCKLASRNAYASLGLTSLVLDLPSYVAAQRSNARLRLTGRRITIDPAIDPSLEVEIEAGGSSYSAEAPLSGTGRRRTYGDDT
jgi:uncharacterized repeat protein (TIGR01451 family)